MKNVFLILTTCMFFIACENNDDVPGVQLSLSECYLNQDNQYAKIDILNSFGKYELETTNKGIADVSWSDYHDNRFYVIAKKEGSTTIKISDEQGRVTTLNVVVSGDIHQPIPISETIFVKKDDTRILKTPQGFDLGRTSVYNGDIIKYSVDFKEKTIYVKAMQLGISQISVSDMLWTRYIFDVTVVDSYDILLNRGDTNLDIYNVDYYFHILCGNGNYTVTSSDNSQGKCELVEYTGDKTLNVLSNPATVRVFDMQAGATFNVTITDGEGKSKTITINTSFFMKPSKTE